MFISAVTVSELLMGVHRADTEAILSRPNDEHLRRCAWTKDIDSVLRLFESAKKRLADLGFSWQDATLFPATTEKLGAFDGRAWRDWIQSVAGGDAPGVEALARFTQRC